MQIAGLTTDQVVMLDMMWYALDTEEEYLNWYENLSPADQRQADVLQRLLIMAAFDEDLAQEKEFPMAKELLEGIMR